MSFNHRTSLYTGRSGALNVTLTTASGQRPLLGYSEDEPPVLACAGGSGEDADLWFAHPSDDDGRDLSRAKALCWTCPIREECLKRNLDEPEGVFGAFDGWERRILREGPGLCQRCRCLVPHSLKHCVPCGKLEIKDRARARVRAAAKEKERG